ncbi:MAG: NAD(P)/FAD-dependent oxidoreductase [Treponema sp.]|nr:NAD(P)/FAD-dependent oxidoreductase [Treponema sp.]
MYDVVIIGAGITGSAAAYELSRYRLSVAVLERENDAAAGVTKANTGIIHAGYDPKPGSFMAWANVEGNRLARELCQKLDVPHSRCGSLVISLNSEDDHRLKALYDRGLQNGVEGLELLSAAEVLALEPNLHPRVRGALLARTAMVTSPWEYAFALMETALRNGVELRLSSEVSAVERVGGTGETGKIGETGFWRVKAGNGIFETRFVVNAAGLQSDKVHNMAFPPAFTITPGRGEYYLFDKSEGGVVKHVIFQCPNDLGKGVTVSPTVHGNLLAGPNFEMPPEREDTSTTRAGLEEIAEKARLSVPGLRFSACIRTFAGIRPASGKDDFIVGEAGDGFFDLAGIKSPGLSSAPAIAKHLVRMLGEKGLVLKEKERVIDSRKRLRFASLPAEEKAALVKANPAYGRIICRCETITEGEILAAFDAPLPPRTMDGVKRRCGPGMGRCQGSFCGPRVLELLTRHFGIAPETVLQEGEGSFVLTGAGHGL